MHCVLQFRLREGVHRMAQNMPLEGYHVILMRAAHQAYRKTARTSMMKGSLKKIILFFFLCLSCTDCTYVHTDDGIRCFLLVWPYEGDKIRFARQLFPACSIHTSCYVHTTIHFVYGYMDLDAICQLSPASNPRHLLNLISSLCLLARCVELSPMHQSSLRSLISTYIYHTHRRTQRI